ncbi:MAG: chromosome segregation protein SMC [Alphaproteobacteria bacterium]|nr:chromosome segregation protein SMC [Alphaproteobacteria bacterium SS10]
MKFAKLRLHGFKSFVEPTELTIEPGLTGVVGPNGCGKSNLVEALRWVMGETSAKRMRGGEMEDVIFGGTANRPARNVAEVVLGLENDGKTAPPPFNDHEHLDIARKIERGNGSDYRINGKPVRARDVQILFADHGTGATSTALVSQGKVGAVINAKPTQRRDILEEAAGISGLHARRHEAELRLRAAENNLERVEDVLGTMDTQLGSLKRQARQAARYRTISDRIRQAEALLLHKKWVDATESLERAQKTFAAAETRVRELLTNVASESTAQAEAANKMPGLRDAAAEAAAKAQRLKIEAEQLANEGKRLEQQQAAAEQRLAQIEQDRGRAEAMRRDADEALKRLSSEQAEIEKARVGETDREAEAVKAAEEAQAKIRELDETVARLTRETASQETAQRNLERQIEQLQQRASNIESERDRLKAMLEKTEAETVDSGKLSGLEKDVSGAEQKLATAEADHGTSEKAVAAADEALTAAREAQQEANSVVSRLQAEIDALQHLLADEVDDETGEPVLKHITVDKGYETALAAALGVALDATLDEGAAFFWRGDVGHKLAVPKGAEPLSKLVKAPDALTSAIAGIGIVDDWDAGEKLAAELKPGQMLVSKDGAAWRWDGYTSRKLHSPDAAAKLEQRNRLDTLLADRKKAEKTADDAISAVAEKQTVLAQARATEQAGRQAVRDAYSAVGTAREALTQATQQQAKAAAEIAGLRERVANHGRDLDEAKAQRETAAKELKAMPSLDEAIQVLDDHREQLGDARTHGNEKSQKVDQIRREVFGRKRRLEAIAQEVRTWTDRINGAQDHHKDLAERATAIGEELTQLRNQPQDLASKEQALLDALSEAEREAKSKADVLVEAERALADIDRRLRQAEGHSADSREARARAEAAVEVARNTCDNLTAEIAEKLECKPDDTLALSEHNPEKDLPPLDDLIRKVERLRRERETLGAVNLRAEEESETLQIEMDALIAERDDLIAAIGRLRQGIGKLKSEARNRLLDAFAKVDQAFQELFVTLFGGGRAQLSLTEAEDPLDAGLDIFASPPGKRLQNLSLLSGGEQALTAIALLFAVFQTNPSPICVLDEVDAPLDEANVDRFCTMLDHMVKTDTTRFLVITHHRMTMARMHRLYGVTMGERGVSQLVAVDLDEGAKLREAS